jgi:error-prone DNA polymerase
MTPSYVEFHARSAFSFLRGGSFPEQLVEQAGKLDLPGLALLDRDGVYGSPRVHKKAKELGLRAIVGSELTLDDGSVLPLIAATQQGYQNLSRLITRAKLRGTKQHAPVQWGELAEFAGGLIALTGDEEGPVQRCLQRDDRAGAGAAVQRLSEVFGEDNVFIEIQRHLRRGEEVINDQLVDLAHATRCPLLATNGVLHATTEERRVLDVFTCAREHTHLDAAGRLLSFNAERHLKPAASMARLFADHPEALGNTLRLAERIEFSLENLGYSFPRYPVPEGDSMDTFLRKVTLEGAHRRYGSVIPPAAQKQIEHELAIIARLGFSGYFLIVWDLVNFCAETDVMVQGRGSAANSVVCYALHITACDPIKYKLLFERFLADGRHTWPDIDLDLPSGDKRESVIQEVYRRYAPNGAAMTANVITFRGRSAMREIGKALNFPTEMLNRFSSLFANGDFPHTVKLDDQLRQSGLPVGHPRTYAAIDLYQRIYGMPRHLGQHSGGMIICQGQLDAIVPLENASMPGRVVAQWDKEDCADLGIIKVDLLGLGMMAVMEETTKLCEKRGRPASMATIPDDDEATYDLMCRADTIGVFQVESRAQMATLPRMQPRVFYDVVIEVAIIRPGPIQGGMLNLYLQRRIDKLNGFELPDFRPDGRSNYFHPDLKPVLTRTLGVPLFQEQLLKMSMVMGGFDGSEAEELRRALSFHRSQDEMAKVTVKLRAAMAQRGVDPQTAEEVIQAVQSFAVYGFPESHAISFGLIAYASCWFKVHRAAEFFTGLLNNQPMGFYSPATLVADGKRHGLRFLPVSVTVSQWFCTVDDDHTIRLGLCYTRGLRQEDGLRIVAERGRRPFTTLADFQLRTGLPKPALRTLSKIGALNDLAEHRRRAQWQVEVPRDPDDLFALAESNRELPLARMDLNERTQADYSGTGLTTGLHPMARLRDRLPEVWRASDLPSARDGTWLRIAGQVICRQRPGTAKGFVFISLEDETGIANAIVTPQLFESQRLLITEEPFLIIEGPLQNQRGVIHLKAVIITPFGAGELTAPPSHDFR